MCTSGRSPFQEQKEEQKRKLRSKGGWVNKRCRRKVKMTVRVGRRGGKTEKKRKQMRSKNSTLIMWEELILNVPQDIKHSPLR